MRNILTAVFTVLFIRVVFSLTTLTVRHFGRQQTSTSGCSCSGRDVLFTETLASEIVCAVVCNNADTCVGFRYDRNEASCKGCSKVSDGSEIGMTGDGMCYTDSKETGSEPSRDCLDVLAANAAAGDGVYTIITRTGTTLDVDCTMSVYGGGWTTMLRRFNGEVAFDVALDEYEAGFGNKNGEHWLGLRNIHEMTNGISSFFRCVSTGAITHFLPVVETYEEWSGFSVDPGPTYALRIGSLTEWTYDTFKEVRDPLLNVSNGFGFSTKHVDRDAMKISCSREFGYGRWWYANCSALNPTGIYLPIGSNVEKSMHNENFLGFLALENMTLMYKRQDSK